MNGPVSAGDSITVLRSRGPRLAKLITPDTILDYGNAKRFDLFEVPLADLDALGRLLHHLLHRPDCGGVRGAIADPTRTKGVRRVARPDPKTGDRVTLIDVPRRWLALDMDGVERPGDTPAHDLAACGALAARTLPAAFWRAKSIVQATAGHGLKPGSRVRLWFWLSRPTTGAELKRWLRGTAADLSVFNVAQVIYTAAPLFDFGASEHLRWRLASLAGEAVVQVPPPRCPRTPSAPGGCTITEAQ